MQTALFSTPAPQTAQMFFCVTASDRDAAQEIAALYYSVYPTPFGDILIASTENGICELHFIEGNGAAESFLKEFQREYPQALLKEETLPEHALAAGFISGKSVPPTPLPIHLIGTSFQQSVWQELLKIPAGTTTTYGTLAAQLQLPAGAARAIGAAVGQNTIAVLVPCHRVVGSAGKLTGFRWGIQRKQQLLLSENSGNSPFQNTL